MTLYVFSMPLMFPRLWENDESLSGNIRDTALYLKKLKVGIPSINNSLRLLKPLMRPTTKRRAKKAGMMNSKAVTHGCLLCTRKFFFVKMSNWRKNFPIF